MRLPRMTTRRWMVAVAGVGLVFGVGRLLVLRQRYLGEAAQHAGFRAYLLRTPENIAYWESRWTSQREGRPASCPWPAKPPFVPAIADYHEAMRLKYEHAARYPWLSVEPDPPELE
jgi:hypothetical protein